MKIYSNVQTMFALEAYCQHSGYYKMAQNLTIIEQVVQKMQNM